VQVAVEKLKAVLRGGEQRDQSEAPIQADLVMAPRDAYFAPAEQIPTDQASGWIAAEKVTPYPPGVPVLVPGERITQPILDYLKAGVGIGMNVTDVADSQLETIRVVA
jgi:arginine/lysine/ornithine decarboxylase